MNIWWVYTAQDIIIMEHDMYWDTTAILQNEWTLPWLKWERQDPLYMLTNIPFDIYIKEEFYIYSVSLSKTEDFMDFQSYFTKLITMASCCILCGCFNPSLSPL